MKQKLEKRNTKKLKHREKNSTSRNERILRELCDQSKQNNICIIGVPEEEEERKRDRKCF